LVATEFNAFGREMPLGLALLPSAAGSLELLVAYRDGLECYSGGPKGLTSSARSALSVETFKVWDSKVLVGGTSLFVFDSGLLLLSSLPAPDDEPIRGLLPLQKSGLLSYSDDESVRHWTVNGEGTLEPTITWPISCLPIYARPNGKAVICIENGRLCERDPDDGRMVKSWAKTPTIVSAFADARGHSLVSIDEEGQGQLWDLHSREPLFAFQTPVRLHHGTFQQDGSAGVLLTQDGDLLAFKVATGGSVKPLAALATPAVDVACGSPGEVIALDENGGLWLMEDEPRELGGAWAVWPFPTAARWSAQPVAKFCSTLC
jgi:WD40 repeat protein